MKIALLVKKLKALNQFEVLLVHTGQHYDFKMSEVFFQELDIPNPSVHLDIGSGSHAVQTAQIMVEFEKVLLREKPAMVLVVGDVNSTLACSLVASKMKIPIGHIEAGLRSFDRGMPEEINRVLTDSISDFLFVSEISGVENLKKEGTSGQIHFVGNTMIDTLMANVKKVEMSQILEKLALTPKNYVVLTLHRPSNVDSAGSLNEIYSIVEAIASRLPVVYPLHPRTKSRMEENGLWEKFGAIEGLQMTEPLGYIDFIRLVKDSRLVLTDSGGIQEESTVLKVPCLTMRENTERPSTVTEGTNHLVGRNAEEILQAVDRIIKGEWKKGSIPEFWDGHTSDRIIAALTKMDFLKNGNSNHAS